MIKCPKCNRNMLYKKGESSSGYEYEFYGCSGYPDYCRETVNMSDVHKYKSDENYSKRSLKEEAEDVRDILLEEGYSGEEADYARHMWEKDK